MPGCNRYESCIILGISYSQWFSLGRNRSGSTRVVQGSRQPVWEACVRHNANSAFTCSGSVGISVEVSVECSKNMQTDVIDIFHVVTDPVWIWYSTLISMSLLDGSLEFGRHWMLDDDMSVIWYLLNSTSLYVPSDTHWFIIVIELVEKGTLWILLSY
jgi:hypothetical protein